MGITWEFSELWGVFGLHVLWCQIFSLRLTFSLRLQGSLYTHVGMLGGVSQLDATVVFRHSFIFLFLRLGNLI